MPALLGLPYLEMSVLIGDDCTRRVEREASSGTRSKQANGQERPIRTIKNLDVQSLYTLRTTARRLQEHKEHTVLPLSSHCYAYLYVCEP